MADVHYHTNAGFDEEEHSVHMENSPQNREIPSPEKVRQNGLADVPEAVLSFHNLRYSVKVGKPWKKTDKQILRDVSGIFEPGVTAIMGPSGSGKTSLLDLLAGTKDPGKGLSGTILLNGGPLPKDFKIMSGYVVQDDVIMGTLTVRENLMFAADLRLPPPRSAEDKTRVVDGLIEELGLVNCVNTRIGTHLLKGVSGGERKRTNIGMELITNPKILFLDEPTTGLDANTSLTVLKILKKLAVNGKRTIICSIHQPRFSIYKLLDTLHLLSSYGQTVYHGAANKAVDYFARQGLPCEEYNNPPDFFLDIILMHASRRLVKDLDFKEEAPKPTKKRFAGAITEEEKLDLADMFKNSAENEGILQRCDTILNKGSSSEYQIKNSTEHFSVNWFLQFWLLCRRALLNYTRNPQESLAPTVMAIAIATIAGCVFWDIETDENGFQNMYGGLFFVAIQMMFANIAAVEVFVYGRALFLHEIKNGYYHPLPFFWAKLISDILPLRSVPTICFSVITYWMFGLDADAGKFFFYILINLGVALSSCGVVFLISVATGVLSIAGGLSVTVLSLMVIFAGLVANKSTIPIPLRYLTYVSIPGWGLAGHAAVQIRDLDFCGPRNYTVNGVWRYDPNFCESGKVLLKRQDIEYGDEDPWIAFSVMAGISILFFGLCFLNVLFLHKKR